MLLELLIHHEYIFINIVKNFIDTPNRANLRALCGLLGVSSAINRALMDIPKAQYILKLRRTIDKIKSMRTITLLDTLGELSKIKYINNKVSYYSYNNNRLLICSVHKECVEPISTKHIFHRYGKYLIFYSIKPRPDWLLHLEKIGIIRCTFSSCIIETIIDST
jgi:hypothetical protein